MGISVHYPPAGDFVTLFPGVISYRLDAANDYSESFARCYFRNRTTAVKISRPGPGAQYFDLIAYVSPMVNWNEFRLVGGTETGGLSR